MIEVRHEFNSAADAVAHLGVQPDDWTDIDDGMETGPRYKYPFGLWFRGEGRSYPEGPLIPGAFRRVGSKVYDEISMFNLFRLRAHEHRHSNNTTFDWLCLMQHYGLPTRLIDWTESPLVALYFAVNNEKYHHKEDGYIYALSARRLNRFTNVSETPSKSSVHVPESFNTAIRAECANSPILESLFRIKSIADCDETDGLNSPDFKSVLDNPSDHEKFLERLRMPTAVHPFRSNGRMIAQYGLFTVHGGRMVQDPPRAKGVAVGPPIHLHEIDHEAGKPIVWSYKICKHKKADIKRQLEQLGIHEGTLYPEIEHQAAYSKRMWLVEGEAPKSGSNGV